MIIVSGEVLSSTGDHKHVYIENRSPLSLYCWWRLLKPKTLFKEANSKIFCVLQAMRNVRSITIWNWTIVRLPGKPCYRTWRALIACCWRPWARTRTDRDYWRPRNGLPRRCCFSLKDTTSVLKVSAFVMCTAFLTCIKCWYNLPGRR